MENMTAAQQNYTADELASLKVPPHSIAAEQSVLGGLMSNGQAWDDVLDRVREDDFYRPEHRLIFRGFESLSRADKPFDVLTIKEHLQQNDQLQSVGGEVYIYELANNTPSVSNITAYADIVRERAILRRLIGASQEIADSAWNTQGRSVKELLDIAERKVLAIGEQDLSSQGPQHIQALVSQTVERIDELSQCDDPITGQPTGFTDLDHMTSGLQRSDLVIVAGRPSMGKTIMAMNIAQSIVIDKKLPILVFSMEMPGDAIAMRMISSLGGIDQHRLRTGRIEDDDWTRISSAINVLTDKPLYVDDTPNLSPADLRARTRRLVKEHGELGLIVVDYLQLMHVPGYRPDNRTAEISEISRSLKALAKESNCPVVALSQLNRSLEQRADKRPVMSDLRESGAIEQDADLILFLYRDEVYHEDSPDKGVAEVIIAKQRNGPIGKVRLAFQGQYVRFTNFAFQDYSTDREVTPTTRPH